ncbi:hypothetical protein [uncultured Gimesia sp.]|uniref:hypothetical protein n=1 Tax=uncultured Gimesia sp. TaxID=1678688 RepID=UPI0030DA56B6|tara:strand:- start:7291 stop:7821 length:531 start_codon:yes stop_codon:yes gene_type:complete
MDEATRLERQSLYLAICRERGWLAEDNTELWPDDDESRTEMARGLFGLTLVSNTDDLFADVRAQIRATDLVAGSDVDGAVATLCSLTDEQKTALLTVLDDFLDSAVHRAMLRLDRFEHGFIKLQLQQSDPDESTPVPGSEIDIISDDHNELFQEAHQWKEEFSRGTEIGRREPEHD